jgi:hypothetical protein
MCTTEEPVNSGLYEYMVLVGVGTENYDSHPAPAGERELRHKEPDFIAREDRECCYMYTHY